MRVFRLVLAVLAVLVLAGCTIRIGNGGQDSAGGSSGAGPGSVDVRSAATPKAGDCITEDSTAPGTGSTGTGPGPGNPAGAGAGSELWVVNCANKEAIEKVTRVVPHGGSDACTTDDYTGFDYTSQKPSLCLMLYGNPGDCYRGFAQRVAQAPRMSCTDPRAGIRLAAICPATPTARPRPVTPWRRACSTAMFLASAIAPTALPPRTDDAPRTARWHPIPRNPSRRVRSGLGLPKSRR